MTQVFLNLDGLQKKLHACGLITNSNDLAAFGRAFGINQPLFSFIDVGSGKERADYKIRETLRLFATNAQCKHIFFGSCSDNGYLAVLDQWKRDTAMRSRLTLIETTPAEPGFISLGFNMIRFPSIFRKQGLPLPGAYQSFPAQRALSPAANMPLMKPSTPAFISQTNGGAPSALESTWATVGKSVSPTKTINIAAKKAPPRRCIILNAYEERLDSELPRTDPGAEKRFVDRLKTGKLCNNFHLANNCTAGEFCDYKHGERLTPGEQLVLMHKARGRSCTAR